MGAVFRCVSDVPESERLPFGWGPEMGLEVLKTLAWEEERVRGEKDKILKLRKDGVSLRSPCVTTQAINYLMTVRLMML